MNIPDNDEGRGDTSDEIAAHRAYEAQLLYTADLITEEVNNHRHFTDDCGDYLKAALNLSSEMAIARMDGPAALLAQMRTLLDTPPDYDPYEHDEPLDRTRLRLDFAGDGVCSEMWAWVERIFSATTCRHCGRRIVNQDGTWIDPEATGDDSMWSETCDEHDTFQAEHEPS